MSKQKLKKISGELKKASKLHAGQANKIDNMVKSSGFKMRSNPFKRNFGIGESPVKGKLKPCQKAAAKRKFDVYPSAYANMWASNYKCQD